MRAVRCVAFGEPEDLVMEDLPELSPGSGEVVIDVHACGINYPDCLIINNQYQVKPDPPFTPGGEVTGTIREVGVGVTGFSPGDKVFATMAYGGLAEQPPLAPVERLLRMPDAADFVTMAAMTFTYGTSHYALVHAGRVQPGDSVLILGAAGGVGTAGIEIARMRGARVIAAASTDEKLEACVGLGADDVVNYSRDDLRGRVKELTDGLGADLVLDPVGGDYALPALRCLGWEGRYVVVGFTAGIPALPANFILLNNLQVTGVLWGMWSLRNRQQYEEDMAEVLQWWRQGQLKPQIMAELPLERAGEAIRVLKDRLAIGKVVVTAR